MLDPYFWRDLVDPFTPILSLNIEALSDLTVYDLQQLRTLWPTLAAERKLKLVEEMISQSEKYIDLNFLEVLLISIDDEDDRVKVATIQGLW